MAMASRDGRSKKGADFADITTNGAAIAFSLGKHSHKVDTLFPMIAQTERPRPEETRRRQRAGIRRGRKQNRSPKSVAALNLAGRKW
jgi:hypothetical protein